MTSREAFENWYDTAEENNEDINCWQAWQAGREALLAEIKARKPYLYGDVALYRLPEGDE